MGDIPRIAKRGDIAMSNSYIGAQTEDRVGPQTVVRALRLLYDKPCSERPRKGHETVFECYDTHFPSYRDTLSQSRGMVQGKKRGWRRSPPPGTVRTRIVMVALVSSWLPLLAASPAFQLCPPPAFSLCAFGK